jgi:hypothetical protein
VIFRSLAAIQRCQNNDPAALQSPSAEAVTHARALRACLNEDDFRWGALEDPSLPALRRKRYSTYRQHLVLFEIELAFTRQLRREAMAAAGDWSDIGPYLRDCCSILKCRAMLRLAGYLFRLDIPGAADMSDAAVYGAFRRLYFTAPA